MNRLPEINPNRTRATEEDFIRAAQFIGCDVATIRAVAQVESARGAFLPSGRPPILFEAHIFSRRTKHEFDDSHPKVSSKIWNRALYKGGEYEYLRLREAMTLDADAALNSASWGRWQIMGFNHAHAGFQTIDAFVAAMFWSEGRQLEAFVNFIRSRGLDDELRRGDWTAFAAGYNGPGFASNRYDERIAKTYARFKAEERNA